MNMCLETSSPRISYSLEFSQSDLIPVEPNLPSLPLSPNTSFEFGTWGSFKFKQSSADEIFENGKILPSPVQRRQASPQCEEARDQGGRPEPLPFLSPLHLCPPSSHGEAMEQAEQENKIRGANLKPEEVIQPKLFWGFRRSSSLDSGNGKRMSFLFPLPVLPRSNSVCSASATQNPNRRQLQQQQSSTPRMSKSSSLSGCAGSLPPNHRSALLRKSHSGGACYSSSIKVAPVLNVPPRCTSSSIPNIFRFGCLSLWGKEKKRRG